MKSPSYKLPCGSKNYYPEIIDYYTRQGKACIFHVVSTRNFKAYVVYPKKKGVDFIVEGTSEEIIHFYETLDLEEHTVTDPNGIFKFKVANDEDHLSDLMEEYIENES